MRSDESVPNTALERLELTPREIHVLGLLARGLTNRGIGAELFISDKTGQRRRLADATLPKLSVPTRASSRPLRRMQLGRYSAAPPPPAS